MLPYQFVTCDSLTAVGCCCVNEFTQTCLPSPYGVSYIKDGYFPPLRIEFDFRYHED